MATEVERRAIEEAAYSAGAREAHPSKSPGSSQGAGLHVEEAIGSMVVDIGGGTTEIAIYPSTEWLDQFALVVTDLMGDCNFVRREYGSVIGDTTAERKMEIGAYLAKVREIEVRVETWLRYSQTVIDCDEVLERFKAVGRHCSSSPGWWSNRPGSWHRMPGWYCVNWRRAR